MTSIHQGSNSTFFKWGLGTIWDAQNMIIEDFMKQIYVPFENQAYLVMGRASIQTLIHVYDLTHSVLVMPFGVVWLCHHHCFRWWLGTLLVPSHYSNQCYSICYLFRALGGPEFVTQRVVSLMFHKLQNNLPKMYNARNHIYGENFKLKLLCVPKAMLWAHIQSFSLNFS